jgi:hypothetical protein
MSGRHTPLTKRHTPLTKSGGWQKAATRESEATIKKSGTWSCGRGPKRGLGCTSSSHRCARNIREPTPRTSLLALEMALGIFAGKAGVLKADPVAKKQKTAPRKAKGDWGGSRRGAAFDAKSASSGTAERKGAKGQPLSE